MIGIFKIFLKDESGATAIEYALLASLISIAMIAGAKSLGGAIQDKFVTITNEVNNSSKK